MARVTVDPNAERLTVFLKHDGKAKVMKYRCRLGRPHEKPIVICSGSAKECGPRPLPSTAADNIGLWLSVSFTYAGSPGVGTRLTFDINQIIKGVSTRIGGLDEEVEIPGDGLDSHGKVYEIC